MMKEKLTKKFNEIGLADLAIVGGKNSSLGEMFTNLSSLGVNIPDGFATTASAFKEFMEQNHFNEPIAELMKQLDRTHYSNLRELGEKARKLLMTGELPLSLLEAVKQSYEELGGVTVAVRSSATAEDLPQASFAGQHESYLNINGEEQLLKAILKCFTSLYTDRAIKYREDHGFAHDQVLLSVGVQKMVRADLASSGVGFTLDPESGFRNVIHLSGVWGLGENIVQGTVTPDEFLIFKPMLRKGKNAIIQKKLGSKMMTMVYADNSDQPTINLETAPEKRELFVLNDHEISRLAEWALIIEDHYKKPMDIEWAKDGETGDLFILQARPETVHSRKDPYHLKEFALKSNREWLVKGQAIGSKISSGVARVLQSPSEAGKLKDGEIVVTELTSPDWDPILKKAAAIITDQGGRTSHASIVARELGVPAVVGSGNATKKISDGQVVTVSCCEGSTGFVYPGKLEWTETDYDFHSVQKPDRTKVMLIAGDPEKAMALSFFPNDGVGLMRMEFIINHYISVHPMALVAFDSVKDDEDRRKIEFLTKHYSDKKEFFIDKLSQGIATIAAAFYPKDVIVRMSDFKTNEYANLLGGKAFEPHEENPMLGFRGASRYYHENYREGFRLECCAVKRVREEMGLDNIKVMIPFCRTLDEGRKVVEVMQESGLDRTKDSGLEIYMMVEIPSNVLLIDQFAEIFDGFSIGSNDLTQLTLGIDRDSETVSPLFSEKDKAATTMIAMAIQGAVKAGRKIGLCGQAPSDFPEFAQFLVKEGISSISFNSDAILRGIENINHAEA